MSMGPVRRLGQRLKPNTTSPTVELVSCEVITVNGDGTLDVYMGADKLTVIPKVSQIESSVVLAPGDNVWALYTDGALLVHGREAT